jgi:hypothetical protein
LHLGILGFVKSEKSIGHGHIGFKLHDGIQEPAAIFFKDLPAFQFTGAAVDHQSNFEIINIFVIGGQVHFVIHFVTFFLFARPIVLEPFFVHVIYFGRVDVAAVGIIVGDGHFLVIFNIRPHGGLVVENLLFGQPEPELVALDGDFAREGFVELFLGTLALAWAITPGPVEIRINKKSRCFITWIKKGK